MVVINWASLCLLKNFPGVIDTGCVLVACLVSVTKHLMKEGFILAQHLRVQSTQTQKVGWQKFEASVYVLSTSGSREQRMLLLTPLLLIQSGTQQMEWCHLPLVNLIWQISDQHAHRFISLAILKPVKLAIKIASLIFPFDSVWKWLHLSSSPILHNILGILPNRATEAASPSWDMVVL